MVDVVDAETRSRMMSGIRSRDTKPERAVRSYLHRAGFRFRLSRSGLPGKPDIVLGRYRSVVFVHGCFWHRHPGCRYTTDPATNSEFWQRKFRENIDRDRRVEKDLVNLGWNVHTIWSCEVNENRLSALALAIRSQADGAKLGSSALRGPPG